MYKIYVVEYGDTLNKISDKFSVSVDILEKINGPINNLVPGMQIVVPNNGNLPFATYIVGKGDSIYDIARKNNANFHDLLLVNALEENDYIYPGQELLIPKIGYGLYVTVDNDTLNAVSAKLKVKAEDMIMQNGALYLMPNQLIIYKKEKSM